MFVCFETAEWPSNLNLVSCLPLSTHIKSRNCHNLLPFCIFFYNIVTQYFIHSASDFIQYFFFSGLRCLDIQILLLQSLKVCDPGQAVQIAGSCSLYLWLLDVRLAPPSVVGSVVVTQSQRIGQKLPLWSATHDCISDAIGLDHHSSPVQWGEPGKSGILGIIKETNSRTQTGHIYYWYLRDEKVVGRCGILIPGWGL